jgi:hypothetical protein
MEGYRHVYEAHLAELMAFKEEDRERGMLRKIYLRFNDDGW